MVPQCVSGNKSHGAVKYNPLTENPCSRVHVQVRHGGPVLMVSVPHISEPGLTRRQQKVTCLFRLLESVVMRPCGRKVAPLHWSLRSDHHQTRSNVFWHRREAFRVTWRMWCVVCSHSWLVLSCFTDSATGLCRVLWHLLLVSCLMSKFRQTWRWVWFRWNLSDLQLFFRPHFSFLDFIFAVLLLSAGCEGLF